MAAPGTIGNLVAPGEDNTNRKIADLERALKELAPSVMESILPLIQEISDAADAAQAAADAANAAAAANAATTAALAVEVARIDSLVNQQVTVALAATVTTSGWATSTGHAAKASSSIAIPAGYSQAFVFALASMHFMDSAPNGGWIRAVISGSAGGEMGGLANLELGQSASHTAALGGLGGGSIGIECEMRSSVATGGMGGRIAQISGYAIFLR